MRMARVVKRNDEWVATGPDVGPSGGRGATIDAALDGLSRDLSLTVLWIFLDEPVSGPGPWPRIAAERPEPFLEPEYQTPNE